MPPPGRRRIAFEEGYADALARLSGKGGQRHGSNGGIKIEPKKSAMSAAATSMVTGVITWFASGSLASLKLYSKAIQDIAFFLPITYTQQALRGFLLYNDSRLLWTNTGYLFIFVVITMVLLILTTRKKLIVK
ncbi:MAG: hypothetical protein A4E54_02282 [Pelotomaculum sp. PtaB.Bin117]|nr:MAG: hypothetical protein A4E54_02282 [Pelotomaculum sp. PtaB.Bin117]